MGNDAHYLHFMIHLTIMFFLKSTFFDDFPRIREMFQWKVIFLFLFSWIAAETQQNASARLKATPTVWHRRKVYRVKEKKKTHKTAKIKAKKLQILEIDHYLSSSLAFFFFFLGPMNEAMSSSSQRIQTVKRLKETLKGNCCRFTFGNTRIFRHVHHWRG